LRIARHYLTHPVGLCDEVGTGQALCIMADCCVSTTSTDRLIKIHQTANYYS
jgi:hypothetical protein